MTNKPITSVHFIGIGGVGMSGVARVAYDQGIKVTGSDLKESRYTKQLKNIGIEVHIGHAASNIPSPGPDVVVVSTAILGNNSELIAAHDRDLEIWHRAEMLAALGVGKKTLAVAGTHGKTTTSAMLASTLDGMAEDPSFLIGGIVRSYKTNARSGKGAYYVVEADESDKSFTYLSPHAILITNIEADHLDHYSDLSEIYEKFREFITSVPQEGVCVVCGEDEALVDLMKETGLRYYTYGFGEANDIVVNNYRPQGVGCSFSCKLPDGKDINGRIKQNPGSHNALNAAGVFGLLWALGLPVDKAADALAEFAGVKRRFDLIAEVKGITIIDDYAHHPTEIAATIAAAKELDFKRIHVVFQPHRYSRASLFTETLHDEFSIAFDDADQVTFTDVYSAGEMPLPGITGKTFMNVVLDHEGHPRTSYIPRSVDLVPYLVSKLQAGDLVITMGAGDITGYGSQLAAALKKS